MTEWCLLLLVLALAWFWMDSIAKREVAVRMGQQLAQRCQLQFLDETVACIQTGFARDGLGRLQLKRTYRFEVTRAGSERLACHLVLRGKELVAWHIPPHLATP